MYIQGAGTGMAGLAVAGLLYAQIWPRFEILCTIITKRTKQCVTWTGKHLVLSVQLRKFNDTL